MMWCVSSVPKPVSSDGLLVGLAVAVGVLQVQESRCCWRRRRRRRRGTTPVGMSSPSAKTVRLVGLAVAVRVFEDDDLVVRLLPGLDLRIDLAAGHPQPALRVPVHLDRLGEQRIGGEEVDLEARRDDERLAFDLRIGIGNLGVPLGKRRLDKKQPARPMKVRFMMILVYLLKRRDREDRRDFDWNFLCGLAASAFQFVFSVFPDSRNANAMRIAS